MSGTTVSSSNPIESNQSRIQVYVRGRLIWLLLFLNCMVVWSQPAAFLHYTVADGLPSNGVRSLAADRVGFVWIGTLNGLARWDGQQIVAFNTLAPRAALPEEDIKLLYSDRQGFLWLKFLHTPGMYRIDLATYRVKIFDDPFFNTRETFPPCAVEDTSGDVWFATRKGLSRYRHATGQFEFFPLVYQDLQDIVIQVTITSAGEIWVGSSKGIFRFDPVSGNYERVPLFDDDHKNHIVASDPEGHLWIGRWYDEPRGVIKFDPVQRKIVQIFTKNDGVAGGFISTEISRIYPEADKVWFCCNEGGLVKYDKTSRQFHRYEPDELNASSLKAWSVMSMTRDPFGNYWVGTEASLDFLPLAEKTSTLFRRNPYQPQNSLCFSKTNTVMAHSGGKMVFGTDRGLSIYHPQAGTWRSVQLPRLYSASYNNVIISLEEEDARSFWAGTWEALYLLDIETGAVLREIPIAVNNVWKSASIPHHLYRDPLGTLWTSYNGSPLQRLKNSGIEVIKTLSDDHQPLNDQTHCFAPLDAQSFLIGTSDGLVRCDLPQTVFQPIPIILPDSKGPAKITSLIRSKTGVYYLIANDGVYRFDLTNRAVVRLLLAFPLKKCLDLIEDDRGDLWICAESGLLRYNPATAESFFFDARNFLSGNTFYPIWLFKKCAKDRQGRLYFAGSSGISVLRPDALAANASPPLAQVTELKINNQTAALDSAVYRISRLSLEWWQNNLTFHLAAPGSSQPSLNRYAYQLIRGRWWNAAPPDEWVAVENNTVDFSNLATGSYLFRVKAANSDGVWSERPFELRIRIRPPWYQSWTAYLFYFFILGALVYGWYRYQLRTRLGQAENERLKELDSFKTRFFTNITHEFRTPLTVILGATEQLKQQFAQRAETAHHRSVELVHRNGENLLMLINQILDLAKLESGKLPLRPEKTDLVGFVRYIVESFHSFAAGKQIQLHFLSDTDELVMDFDKEKMQSILSNLLSNACKFTPEGGHIYIQMEKAGGNCLLKVRDTGIGISEENLPYIFERFYQADNSTTRKGEGTGIGLALTRELVRLMGGEISAQSKPGAGATFLISLPIVNTLAERNDQLPVRSFVPAEAPAQAALAGSNDPERPLLLVVEDNADVREFLLSCVSDRYNIVEARDGQEGIEKALEHVPDLIVSDVMMPRKDGFELCRTLKNDARSSHIPLVLLTAKADVGSRIEGFARGADEYIAKPFHREELLARLQNLLENRRRLQARYATLPLPAVSDDPDLQPEDSFLQKMREVVERHLSEVDFEMPQLERAMGMSRSQIFRKVKALTGRSPSMFIRSVRLYRAKELLRDPKLSISEVAYEVGFSTPAYFSTAFLEEFGKNPTEFRQG
ncbi:MAG: ATP-binding protein [Saprospiraceae bacterium]|nr:ATP-binding protein [Saprospiraceae bacterium]